MLSKDEYPIFKIFGISVTIPHKFLHADKQIVCSIISYEQLSTFVHKTWN